MTKKNKVSGICPKCSHYGKLKIESAAVPGYGWKKIYRCEKCNNPVYFEDDIKK